MHSELEGIPSKPFPNAPPNFLLRFGIGLHRFLRNLAYAIVPPEVALFEKVVGVASTQLVALAARLEIADRLAAGPRTAADLAVELQVDGDALHRSLRALAHFGIFTLKHDGTFANNKTSKALLRAAPSRINEFAKYFATESNTRAWLGVEQTLRNHGKNAFELQHGMNVWAWFDAHPEERAGFARAMMGMTFGDAPFIAKLYPWAEVGHVCDVGGGRGSLLSELLLRFPSLRATLVDQADVLHLARDLLAARGVGGRTELVAGSFFDAVPEGADAYILKNVLHDWDDRASKTILSVVRRAARPGTKVVIVEALQERNDSGSFAAPADVQMMVVCQEGRERSRAELAALLEASGFRLGRVAETPLVAVLEGVAV